MFTDEVFFDAHVDNIMYDLKVNPEILYGEDAVKAASRYDRLGNGAFLWENYEHQVALRNKTSIATVAHEMRHCWQYFHSSDKFKFKRPAKYSKLRNFFRRIIYDMFYLFNNKELDAEKYSIYYCKRNKLSYDLTKATTVHRTGKWLASAIVLSLCALLYVIFDKIVIRVQ